MAKILGYIIGAVLLMGLLFPVPASIYFTYNALVAALTFERESAQITDCYSYRQKSSNRASTSFGPVAVSPSGTKAKGGFRWQKKAWCEYSIGDQVEILIDPKDRKNVLINSFMQLWFYPLLFSFLAIVISFAIYKNVKKRLANKTKN
ncbi:DUF3592 domain-containing protein [Aliiglaciecola sp. M165]|uniref:DUF3592 domain-containing protein n=1 Tax=Aliiglaciecola sp. M165 TaxID=2593649 RepID=UPI001180C573|nr:DUF3592 domain-containing protein [Aliiglaciecola sp. M165]TRY33140.1 hypothetical protein FM019_03910 [Aliiglaciecola sp. M165]